MKQSGTWSMALLAALPLMGAAQAQPKSGPTEGMEMSDLIDRVARRMGKQFVIDPRVRAQVSLAGIEPAQLTYDQLLAILDVHQYTVTEAGGILAVVPDANARQLPTPVHAASGFTARDHEIVTLLLTPKSVCSAWLVPVLRPLLPQAAHMAADVQTNSLIISDRASNARRIANLVEQLDRRGKGVTDCPPPASPVATATAAKPPAGS